jgi:glutaconate CoA-transferase subunit B
MGIFAFDPETCEMVLTSLHPGVTVEMVQEQTDWPVRISTGLSQTPPPTHQELSTLRRFDPNGYWTGK